MREDISIQRKINLELINLNYAYETDQSLFVNLNLELKIDLDKMNVLYGIIGPSGIGKTSLINILGAQLKPKSGRVLLNQTDIYSINETSKSALIGLQLQTSTSLRGTIRENLIFGIPHDFAYGDELFVELLKKVGLWKLFEIKQGLETFVGEGGVTLSGGQRQRLNFASLYLRATFYRPRLVLIDEPTSSLDEHSEIAITKMIDDLSKNSLTLVVAHRLKTLTNAVGIFDLTLFNSTKNLMFYSPKELKKISNYYDDLVSGKQFLEN